MQVKDVKIASQGYKIRERIYCKLKNDYNIIKYLDLLNKNEYIILLMNTSKLITIDPLILETLNLN